MTSKEITRSVTHPPLTQYAPIKRPSRRDMLEYIPERYIYARCGDDFECIDSVSSPLFSSYMGSDLQLPMRRRPNRLDMLEIVNQRRR